MICRAWASTGPSTISPSTRTARRVPLGSFEDALRRASSTCGGAGRIGRAHDADLVGVHARGAGETHRGGVGRLEREGVEVLEVQEHGVQRHELPRPRRDERPGPGVARHVA